MLRLNKDERVRDRILVLADVHHGWETILAWCVSRSQEGDVIFVLNVMGGPWQSPTGEGTVLAEWSTGQVLAWRDITVWTPPVLSKEIGGISGILQGHGDS